MSSPVTATFVFTDLVDSTALSALLGPEASEELRQTHFRLLRSAIAASAGSEVKNLGDGVMVIYSSPSRAVAGAVGMQQAVEHHNRSGGQRLAIRVGMSMGEAVEENGDYFGDPVIEAARLCATANGGQILASDLVRLVVGRFASHAFAALGPLPLKGIPEPVDTVEVLWEPANVEGSVPLPGRLVSAAADALFGFFGRGNELAVLEDTRKRARSSGRIQVALVAGEAGVGKTALVAHVARAAHAGGAIVLLGHVDEDLGIAYQPWIEVLEPLVHDGDPGFVCGMRAAQRGALARLVPDVVDESVRFAEPDLERLLLLEAVTELLAAASKEAPVFVVLDDLHLADTSSLQVLRHVIASTTPMDVTIACTYRNTELGRGAPLTKLLADLHREANVARITLRGLEDNELVELLAAAAGHELDDRGVGLAHALRRETDGNPFFTAEIVRHLFETGGIFSGDDGRWRVASDLDQLVLPTSVRDVVGRRVERLGDEAIRVLSVAAVLGREFEINVLAEIADVDEDSLVDLLETAVSAAVLVESNVGDRYRFAHALIQHSLYEELSPTRRQRTHQRVAQVLEAQTSGDDLARLAELAHHWVAATRPAHLDKALGYVRRAGDAACDALAPEDAVRWYEQALDLVARQSPADDRQRADLLAALGTAQRQAARPEHRDTLFEAASLAQQLSMDETVIRAALGFIAGGTHVQVGDSRAKAVIRAALDRIGPDSMPIRARLLAGLASAHDAGIEWRDCQRLMLEAVDIARRVDDDVVFLEVFDLAYYMLATPDRRDQHADDTERALAMADRLGDPVLRLRIRNLMMWARYQQADLAGADAVLSEIETLTETVGLAYLRYRHAYFVTGRLLLAGHATEAEKANERLLELGTTADIPEAMAIFGALLYAIRSHQGRLAEIADLFIEAARNNPSIPQLRSAATLMLSELGRIDEACERLAAEKANGFDYPYDMLWLAAMANVTDAAATVKDRTAGRMLCERLAPFANHVISPAGIYVMGAIARPLGRAAALLADYDQAERWFEMAHNIHNRLQAPFWIALGQLDHADLCLLRQGEGDVARARQLATTAAATSAEYGCADLTRRSAGMLADI